MLTAREPMTAREQLLRAGVTHLTMALLDDIANNDPYAIDGDTVYDYILDAINEVKEFARRFGA